MAWLVAGVTLAAAPESGNCRAEPISAATTSDAADGSADEGTIRGIELGDFQIRAYYPVEAQKSHIRFVLHAAVKSDRYAEARQLVENRRQKLRDQVITVTRMTPLPVFDDPELASFRRRILLRLRRTLAELPIEDIYVSDFQLTVQSL